MTSVTKSNELAPEPDDERANKFYRHFILTMMQLWVFIADSRASLEPQNSDHAIIFPNKKFVAGFKKQHHDILSQRNNQRQKATVCYDSIWGKCDFPFEFWFMTVFQLILLQTSKTFLCLAKREGNVKMLNKNCATLDLENIFRKVFVIFLLTQISSTLQMSG